MLIHKDDVEYIEKSPRTINIGLSGDDLIKILRGEVVGLNSGFCVNLAIYHFGQAHDVIKGKSTE